MASRRIVRDGALGLGAALLASCSDSDAAVPPDTETASALRFADVSETCGIDFFDTHGPVGTDKQYLHQTLGGGVGLLDHDADGDLDVFLANGDPGDGSPPSPSALFRNDGDFRFADVTASVGAGVVRDANGVAVGDVDNDGFDDLFVGAYGPNVLLRNAGGRFEDVSESAGVADARHAASSVLADFDGDGDLDLFVANYIVWDEAAFELSREGGTFREFRVIGGPRGLVGAADQLLANRSESGALRFEDVTEEAGLADSRSFGLGALAADLDRDGDTDLYVANDSEFNSLFLNDGDMRFVDHGLVSGTAASGSGQPQAGMGVDLGDADGDGRADLFVTNFSHDHYTLYVARGPAIFADRSRAFGLFGPTFLPLGFGTAFLDADLDGDLDLAAANGHVFPSMDDYSLNTTYAQVDQVFENLGTGRFREVEAPWLPTAKKRVSRGLARGDLDGDGREDLVITTLNARPLILRNECEAGRAVVVRLVGGDSNRSAIGAVVEADVGGGRVLVRHVTGGGSFYSASSRDVVIGLGSEARVEGLTIHWPSGLEQAIGAIESGVLAVVREGEPDLETTALVRGGD